MKIFYNRYTMTTPWDLLTVDYSSELIVCMDNIGAIWMADDGMYLYCNPVMCKK